MSELNGTRLKTGDKRLAVELVERCLESAVPMNARVQHLDGVYSVEVSAFTKRCLDGELDRLLNSPASVQRTTGSESR